LVKAAVISLAVSLSAGCGNNFEWFPDAGSTSSTSSTTSSTVGNTAPVANAGPAQSVPVGTKVTLAGSVTDANVGDTITYSWSFKSKPSGSKAELSSATDVRPTFTADVAGDYVIQLVANDGKANSAASTVTITANTTPVAKAGTDQNVVTGTAVTLDGSGSSDADGDTLKYLWKIDSKPANSNAALSSTTVAKPTFTPDLAGTYVFSLIVNDGKVDSVASTVKITATDTGAVSVSW